MLGPLARGLVAAAPLLLPTPHHAAPPAPSPVPATAPPPRHVPLPRAAAIAPTERAERAPAVLRGARAERVARPLFVGADAAGCQAPDQQGHGPEGVLAATSDANPSSGFAVAESFRAAAPGSVTSVRWWGIYFDFAQGADCGPGPGDAFTLTYRRDDANGLVPGSVLAGPFAVRPRKAPTGARLAAGGLSVTEWAFEAEHPPVPVGPEGCTWIEVRNATSGSCTWLWSTAPPGDGRAAQADTGWVPASFDLAVCVDVALVREGCVFVDCDASGTADAWDIANGLAEDCDADGVPDACGVAGADCDANGVPDACELDGGDANGDGVLDACEPGCEEFDRFAELTPNDTLTFTTQSHDPQQAQGFAYAYAVDALGRGIGFDRLIGQVLVVDGIDVFEYSMNAVDYRAAVPELARTDLGAADGVRDLNGLEYERTAGEVLVPRFLGQTAGVASHLVLLSLSGGAEFTTTVDLLVYNDDEDLFSARHTFRCWDRVPLAELSSAFTNEFLAEKSGDDPTESVGPGQETGWLRVQGSHASSAAFDLLDPAVYAVLVERVGGVAAADLPFEICLQSGHLLPRGLAGDDEEVPGAPSDQDCAVRALRRRGASLLLYPEFDNRDGVATIYTITNTHAELGVRVHFVYVGRFR